MTLFEGNGTSESSPPRWEWLQVDGGIETDITDRRPLYVIYDPVSRQQVRNFPLANADGALRLTADDLGKQIKVRVTYLDDDCFEEVVTSEASATVTAGPFSLGGLSDATAAENTAFTSAVPTLTGSPTGAVTWSLEGVDYDFFSVSQTDGVVSLAGRNFEQPGDTNRDNVYAVTLVATDSDHYAATAPFTVTVTDVVETATVTIGGLPNATTTPENLAWTSPMPTVTGAIGTVNWTKSGADAALFTQAYDGQLMLPAQDYESPADADGDNVYAVTVRATDAEENTDWQSIEVTVTDVHGTSTMTIGGLANATAPENAAWTSPVPTVTGAVSAVTWTKSGADAALFALASDGRLTLPAQDYEAPADADADGVYEVTLRAADADAHEDTHSLEVTVSDVVETATVTIGGLSNATTTPENVSWTSPRPTVTGVPGVIGAVTWTRSGADAALFTQASDGRLTLGAQDYETPADADNDNVYEATVTVTDADANEDTHSIEVTVTDVIETSTVTITGLSNAATPENAVWTSPMPTASGAIGAVTWSKSGADAGLFTLASDGRLTLSAQDYEAPADANGDNEYEVTVRAEDEDGNAGTASIEVAVTDVTEVSTLTVSGLVDDSAPENVSWTSPRPTVTGVPGVIGEVTWSKSGPDAGAFTLGADGRLTLPAQDYEASTDVNLDNDYQVTVRAEDADANAAQVSITISVTDSTETSIVTIGGLSNATTPENAAWTSPTPTVTGAIGAVTWTKSGADAGLFTQGSDGRLTLGAQDYETPADADADGVYEVTLHAVDADANEDTHSLEVTVSDVVETSTVTIGGLSNATTPENAAWTSPVPTAAGAIGAVTWTKYGADAQQFTQGANGTLTLPAQDYETPADADNDNVYEATVTVTDADANEDTHSIEVTVTDVIETSTVTITGLSNAATPENAVWTSPMPTASGAIGAVTWSKSGADAGLFTLASDGRLTLSAQDYEAPADADADGLYEVTLRAVDADANEDTHSLEVTVTDVVERSTVTIGGLSNATTPENAAWTSPVPTAAGAIGAVTWSKSGADAGLFTLASDGRLTLSAQDYEAPADADADGVYEVTLRAVDADANEDTHSLEVTVTDVVETATVTIGGLSNATTPENVAWTSPSPTATGGIGAVTWSKSGTDAALFTQASDGRLTLGAQDYETPADADGDNVYEATVVATDADQNTDGQPIEVTVTDVIETSTVTIGGLSNATTPENAAWTSPSPTATGGIGAVTWSKSGADAALFIQASDGRLTLGAQDYETPADADNDNVYEVTVVATDADANEDTHSLEVTVTDVVETSTVTIGGLSDATAPENSTWTSPIPTASGAIGAVTWSKSGADAGMFTLGSDGRLTLPAQDFESPADANGDNEYEVTVRAEDEDGNAGTASIEVAVTDVTEVSTLTVSGLTDDSAPENVSWTSPRPTVTGVPGVIGEVTWSKSGPDAGAFTLGADGRLTLGAQDYETPADADGDNVYEATVVATDADQNTDGQSIEVTVTDVIETSTVTIGGLSNATAPENSTWTSPVPTASGAIGAVTWTKSGADAQQFTQGANGTLTLPAQDYETPADADGDNVYEATVVATDADQNTDGQPIEMTVTDVIETSTVTIGGLSNATTPENAAWTSPVPTAAGAIGAVTWTKSGADAGLFTLASDGRLTLLAQDFEAPADADADGVYEVTLRAVDADANEDTHSLEVTVTDVVETSTVTIGGLSNATTPENASWTSPAPSASGAIGAVTWSKSGADAGMFTLGSDGRLTLPAQDFESPADANGDNEYEVTVRAEDEDGNAGTASIEVAVTDVTEVSTLTVSGLADDSAPENVSWTSPRPTVTGMPGVIGEVTWSKSGPDAGAFTLGADGRLTLPAQDYEAPTDVNLDNDYQVTVRAEDADANAAQVSITISVTDSTETSTVTIGGLSNATTPENAAWTSPTPTVTGAIGAEIWTKSGADAGLFTQGSEGRLTLGAQDYETPADADGDNVYEATVTVTDADANEDTHSLEVTVSDVVETSTVTIGGLSDATTAENAAWTSPSPTATGAIGAVTWTKSGADAALFTQASDGRLTLGAQDYETPADADADGVYEVTLRAVDADANEDTHSLEVTVTDVVETATVTIGGLSNATTPENAAWMSPVPTAAGAIGAVTWSKSGADAALFTQASDGRLTLGAQDYESPADADGDNVYEATVVATDADQNTDGQSIEVTVTDVIETSAVTIGGLSNATTPENAAWTSPAPTATGGIGAVTWSKSGADAALFTQASDGRLTLGAQDYETPADVNLDNDYQVTVRAEDADANAAQVSITISVTDSTETSTVTIGGLSDASTAENAAWTSPVPTAAGAIGAVTWSKSGADAGLFTLASDGRLTLSAQDFEAPADADADGLYEVTLRAVDADANEDTHSLEVTVTDVVETATVTIGGLSNATTPENATWTSPIPTAAGAIGAVTWSKSGADAALFTQASAGRLTLGAQDYETPADADGDNVYEATVVATDADQNTDGQSIEVTVTDVIEASTVTIGGLSNATTPENAAWTSPVPTAAGAIGAVTWSKSGADAGLFTQGSDGRLTLGAQDYETPADADGDNVYEVTVAATDADQNTDGQSIEVTVTDVIETSAVTIGGLSNATTPENAAWTSPSPTATGAIGAVTWSKSGADAALFTQASDGQLTLGAQDYETPADADGDNVYEVTVAATDADQNTDGQSIEVTVTDVVETATVTIGGLSNATAPENSTWTSPIPTAAGAIGAVTWSKSGADAGLFTLAPDGRLTLPAQDYEAPADVNLDNAYQVTVRAEDVDANAAQVSITISVTDSTETSTVTVDGLSDASTAENAAWTSPVPTAVGAIGAVTWTKSGPDAGLFTQAPDGRLTLGAQDYETHADANADNVYEVTPTATDGDGNVGARSIGVVVTDVVETSTVTIGGLSNATTPENSTWTSPAPTASGAISAVTWGKSGADAALFTQASDGRLTLGAQDYETPADANADNVYAVTVTATDADDNVGAHSIEVAVTDVVERSTVTIEGPSGATTPENRAWTSPVPRAAGAIGAVAWSKSGPDTDEFTVALDGRLTLRAQDFDAPADANADNVYEVTLRAQDADGNADTHSIRVTVYEVFAVEGDLDLDGPGDGNEGRLQIFHKGRWGTVCDDTLDNRDNIAVEFACRLMGYETGELVSNEGRPQAPSGMKIWLDDVRCYEGSTHWTGEPPTKLSHCYHAGWGLNNCSHAEDAWLRCTGVAEAGESAVPGRVAGLLVSAAGSDGLSVLWQVPPGPAPTGYEIEYREPGESWRSSPHAGTGTQAAITGLSADRAYEVRVRGVNDQGAGEWSETSTARTDPERPEPPAALTAAFEDVPASHDGSKFWITLRFSKPIRSSYKILRDERLVVTNGDATRARRVNGDSALWEIEIAPSGTATVTVRLPADGLTCDAGGVCTSNGRVLSTGASATVPSGTMDPGGGAWGTSPGAATVRGARLTLRYDAALDGGSVPSVRDFVVTAGPPDGASAVPVMSVSVDGDAVSLTLARPVLPDETVYVSYLVAPMHPVQDTSGSRAAPLADLAVRNATRIAAPRRLEAAAAAASPGAATALPVSGPAPEAREPLDLSPWLADGGASAPLGRLDLSSRTILDIDALAGLTALRALHLEDNGVVDLGPLSALTGLRVLDLSSNAIADVGPLSALTELERLNLSGNRIADVSALSGLKGLKVLLLHGNRIDDLLPLWSLQGLLHLGLAGNRVADIGLLAELASLQRLDLTGNRVSDVSPLGDLSRLVWLRLAGNPVAQMSPLGRLTLLRWLWLDAGVVGREALKAPGRAHGTPLRIEGVPARERNGEQ